MYIIAQALSIVGCAFMILSFQFKNNRNLFIAQTLSAIAFGTSNFLLGALSGVLINIVATINGLILFCGKRFRKKPILILICLSYACIPIISLLNTFGNWSTKGILEIVFGLFLSFAQAISTVAMWKNNGKLIRFARIFFASPSWLLYNLVVFSLGGIICEAFSITSIIVSFIRYGKDGFEK